MTGGEDDQPSEGQLFEEAAAWFARMRGPDAETWRLGFEAWLARGALHRAAYNRASEIFAMGKLLDDEPRARTATKNKLRGRPGKRLLGVVGIALVALLGTWAMLAMGPGSRMLPDSRNAPSGQISTAELDAGDRQALVRLVDGSRVRLERGTRIAVMFEAAERNLTLERGSARFEVAHEPRPFVVHAGGGSVTAHGTIFNVALTAGQQVSVRLIEGSVDVALPSAVQALGQPARRRLRPGEALSFVAAPSQQENARVLAPPPGGAVSAPLAQDYDAIALSDLLTMANRKARPRIRLADPATGAQRVSGRFAIGDTDLLAERLALLFNLEIDRSQAGEIVLKPR